MNIFEKIFKKIITIRFLAAWILKGALRLHNWSYKAAGMAGTALEPGGLHPKHRLMVYHDWFAKRLKPDWDVLDIGCGNGALTYDIKSACRSVTGIDIVKKKIDTAKKKYASEGISYICADAISYEFNSKFQAIILSNVLEHIKHRTEFLKQIFGNHNEGKPPVLLLRVPMVTRDWISLFKKEVGVEWRLDNSHFTEYTLEQVFEEIEAADLSIESYDVMFGEFYGVIRKR